MAAERLRALMQELHDAHRHFRQEWDKWWGNGVKSPEPDKVKKARDRFWDALNRLFDEQLEPLHSSFKSDREKTVDAVIDFLEIDVPAHRCGYEKEKYLRKLKAVTLSDS